MEGADAFGLVGSVKERLELRAFLIEGERGFGPGDEAGLGGHEREGSARGKLFDQRAGEVFGRAIGKPARLPQSWAVAAGRISPVRTSRAARARPTSDSSSRWAPPAPGIRPRLVSGRPSCAVVPSTRQSAISASSQPAAKREAIDGGDQRFREGADHGPMRLAGVGGPFGSGLPLDLGNVGPGGEVALGPGQEHGAAGRVTRKIRQHRGQPGQKRGVQGVLRLRAVQDEPGPGPLGSTISSMDCILHGGEKFQARNFKLEIIFAKWQGSFSQGLEGGSSEGSLPWGGPAGLYFAISMEPRDPSHQVTVLERNRADDTFGGASCCRTMPWRG